MLTTVAIVLTVAFVISRIGRARRTLGPGSLTERERTPFSLLPGTSAGWWSVRLGLAFMVALASVQTVLSGLDPFDADTDRATAAVARIALGGAAGAAVLTGFVAVRRRAERSVLVFASIAISTWVGLIR